MNEKFREDLDEIIAQGCSVPGCKHDHGFEKALYLHQRCHPKGQIQVCYEFGTGVLKVECAECGATIVNVAVASNAKN